jgi:hypothetical protein
MGEMTNAHKVLIGKSEGKRSFGRPRHRYEDNIGMDPRGIGWENVEWIHLAQERENCKYGNEHSGSIRGEEFLG